MSERMTAGAGEGGESALGPSDEEIVGLEDLYPEGLTAREVVEIFKSRGVKLSEATLRKYVQLGLLPRSRRVRRQGRRGGSQGRYPVNVVRRIREIKQLLAEDYTMEEIRARFLCATSELDELEESLGRALARLESTVSELERAGQDVTRLRGELQRIRLSIEELTEALRRFDRRLEAQSRGRVALRKIVG